MDTIRVSLAATAVRDRAPRWDASPLSQDSLGTQHGRAHGSGSEAGPLSPPPHTPPADEGQLDSTPTVAVRLDAALAAADEVDEGQLGEEDQTAGPTHDPRISGLVDELRGVDVRAGCRSRSQQR